MAEADEVIRTKLRQQLEQVGNHSQLRNYKAGHFPIVNY